MTMLEKAARAICLEYNKGCGFDGDGAQAETEEMWREWIGEARAALQAVREPDSALQFAAWLSAPDDDCSDFQRLSDFTAMIDAIISEGEA
jgi:hypothetical protein